MMWWPWDNCPMRTRHWWHALLLRYTPHRPELLKVVESGYGHHEYRVRLRCRDCLAEIETYWQDHDFLEHNEMPPA